MMDMRFEKSKRGGDVLYVADFKFRVNKKVEGKIYWRCTENGCKSVGVTRGLHQLLKGPSPHNGHAPSSPTHATASALISEMKERVVDQPQRPLKKIYNDVVQEAINNDPGKADDLTSSLPTFYSCRMSLHRSRKKNEPILPKQRADIDFTDDLMTTTDGRMFLQANDGDADKILLFATDQGIARACAAKTIYVDGTFYVSPRLFTQLFTFHVEMYGRLFPVMFAFLPDKCQRTYRRLFQIIKTKAVVQGLQFHPDNIQSDYELAIINAAKTEFPQARIVGCMFHLVSVSGGRYRI